jgi:hypothetical protein
MSEKQEWQKRRNTISFFSSISAPTSTETTYMALLDLFTTCVTAISGITREIRYFGTSSPSRSGLSNYVISVPRGFRSSIDIPPYWMARADDANRIEISLVCMCGFEFPIQPDSRGIYKWTHRNCLSGTLKLEDYEVLYMTKAEKKKWKQSQS